MVSLHQAVSSAYGARRGAGGVRQRVGDPLERVVVVGGGQEPRLERRRRQVDAAREHRVEERREAEGLLAARAVVVDDRRPALKKTENMLPACCRRCATPSAASARGRQAAELGGGLVDVGVDLVGGSAQRREPGRGGERVPRQRAGLVDGTDGCQPGHHVGAAAERRGREAAAHHLAERHQVGAHAVEAEPAGAAHPEAGHHLVADVERAVARGTARPGRR